MITSGASPHDGEDLWDMATRRIAKLAFWLDPSDSYSSWTKECVEAVGFCSEWIDSSQIERLPEFDGLVMFGSSHSLAPSLFQAILQWHHSGKKVLFACGSAFGFESVLGLEAPRNPLWYGRNHAVPGDAPEAIWPEGANRILFVGGTKACASTSLPLVKSATGEALLTKRGSCYFFAPHLGQTLALIGGGRAVGNDIIGPGDGSADTMHGQVRSESGTNLRFDQDRVELGDSAPIFGEPHIDSLRNLWAASLIEALEEIDLRTAIAWHLPENAHSAIVCSVDCSSAATENIRKVAGGLMKYGMPATWLVASPGFPQDVYKALDKWDHETGLLFRPEPGPLEEHMRVQYLQTLRAAPRSILTLRGFDNFWHGLTTLYEAAEAAGAKICATKGGVQPGTSGYLFGTARPFFPIRRGGKPFNVLEFPFASNNPGVTTPLAGLDHLVSQAHFSHGIFHLTLSTSGANDLDFESGLSTALSTARHRRMSQFTLERIFHYEKARRTLQWRQDGECLVIRTDVTIKDLTVMVTGDDLQPETAGKKHNIAQMRRYNHLFTCATIDIDGRSQIAMRFRPIALAA
ncbi:MAG: hypothetical protein MUC92_08350 [Fimbriimonadaceae bacterium]|jgi:hypothetical protein|nr:hypothetical protein [Fimbriimonadaceae bacterium]